MGTVRVIHPITRLIVGGAQQNTLETCAGLNPQRYETCIVCGAETGPEGELLSAARARGVALHIMPELVRRPDPRRDLQALARLTAWFRFERPHIVHTHSSKTGMLGRWAARRARVPVIVHTVHGWGHHDRQHPLVRRLYIALERRTAPVTDRLVVVSVLNRDKGLRDGIGAPAQYVTIRSAIDVQAFSDAAGDVTALKRELGLRPGVPVVGTIGRLSPQKNPADFIRVAAAVKASGTPAQFLFVGDGPLRGEVQSRIRDAGLAQDVVLAGLRSDVPQVLRCMDVFILTSLWEGLPRVIPQAMAAGVPVVANAVDGVGEVIRDGENGFTVAPGQIDRMSRIITGLLGDADQCRALARAGRSTARDHFSLGRMLADIECLYEQLLAEKGVAC